MADRYNTTGLWRDYELGKAYQSTIGLTKNLPTFVRFFEGKQWPAPTDKTKKLPRPVVNVIKMICRNKKSAILSTPVKLVYTAEDERVDTELFNHFSEYIQKELGQVALDKRAIDDAVKKGCYFYHYFWDAEARGKRGNVEGALRCEIIDPLNIFFANPREHDEQKQKWILIASREDVSAVRAKADSDVDVESIVADAQDDKYGTPEQEGDRLCTVLTRYFRRDGEVYCEMATKGAIIKAPFPISPDIAAARAALGVDGDGDGAGIDAPNNHLPDKAETDMELPKSPAAYLYPIVAGSYESREDSIYGIGEVEGLIPNQKAINFFLAMALLNAQENAWGKYIVLPGALGHQTIKNEPGQVLTDYSKTGKGIRKMTEQTMQAQPLQLVDTLTSLTRVVTGSSEVMTGESIGSSMSGAAIAQLQSQALIPTEELKESFWIVKEKQGKVLAQFFKLFYSDKEFTYEDDIPVRDGTGAIAYDTAGNVMMERRHVSASFNGGDFSDVDFDVVVEATGGTKASAAGDISALDNLLAQNRISLRTYLDAYPNDSLSNKAKIIKGVEEDEQGQVVQLTAQVQSLTAQLAEMAKMAESRRETAEQVEKVIGENERLRILLARLYTESAEKIRTANARIAEAQSDASQFAHDIADAIGMKPTV